MWSRFVVNDTEDRFNEKAQSVLRISLCPVCLCWSSQMHSWCTYVWTKRNGHLFEVEEAVYLT